MSINFDACVTASLDAARKARTEPVMLLFGNEEYQAIFEMVAMTNHIPGAVLDCVSAYRGLPLRRMSQPGVAVITRPRKPLRTRKP